MLTISLVNGSEFAERASSILCDAWQPPSLLYTPSYLQWQFQFPGGFGSHAVAAFDQGSPVGFAGITPRRFRCNSIQWDGGILSFVSVLRAYQGRGIALKLYEHLLNVCGSKPVIVFVQPGTGGERTLVRAVAAAGMQIREIGTYRLYGCLPCSPRRQNLGQGPLCEVRTASVTEACSILDQSLALCSVASDVIWGDPDAAQIEHYLLDPRGRSLVSGFAPDGRLLAAAWVTDMQSVQSQGTQLLRAIDSVYPAHDAAAFLSIVDSVAKSCAGSSVDLITAPNVAVLDQTVLRSAGLRAMPSSFRGYMCGAPLPSWAESVRLTNIEIV